MTRIVKKLKNNNKIIIAFILGIIISGTGVYAVTVISANSISYTDNVSLGATNVQDAIDKLYVKANNQYFDLATAQTNTKGTIFASKKGICISRNKKVSCFKINNWSVEKNNIQEAFSDVSCTIDSSHVYCAWTDFGCNVYSNGHVHCSDYSDGSRCIVYSSGIVDCN